MQFAVESSINSYVNWFINLLAVFIMIITYLKINIQNSKQELEKQ